MEMPSQIIAGSKKVSSQNIEPSQAALGTHRAEAALANVSSCSPGKLGFLKNRLALFFQAENPAV